MPMEARELLRRNRDWAERTARQAPGRFDELARGQSPPFLWIGCSDSRVPPTRIVDGRPGELFVHRNVANRVSPDDPNSLSVVQYAVEALEVPHVVVCGHYGCGGVRAALDAAAGRQATDGKADDGPAADRSPGGGADGGATTGRSSGDAPEATGGGADPLSRWIHPIVELHARHREELEALPDDGERWDRLCELNVAEQVRTVARLPVVREAWDRGRELAVHGWIYRLEDGRIRDLEVTVEGAGAQPD